MPSAVTGLLLAPSRGHIPAHFIRFRLSVTGVSVRQLILRLRTCEAGAGLVEYALIIAVVALGLVAVLRIFRNSVGTLTNRTAVTISKQSAGGYGGGGGAMAPPSETTIGYEPAPSGSDSSASEPDSSSAGGHTTGAFRFW